jgi:FMN-dependent NADH-azoreductase
MTTLLHISASPRGKASEGLAIADTFLDAYRASHPDHQVETFDLWDGTLPVFGPDAAEAEMTVFAGQELSPAAAEAWESVKRTFERFAAPDAYLFSVPMWNSGVPYVLKQFIDVVTQPGLAFGFDPQQGYTGLVTGKKAAVVYTGAVYGPGRPPSFGQDFQKPFFNSWLRMCGITDITEIEFRPNMVTADADQQRKQAHADAVKAAENF